MAGIHKVFVAGNLAAKPLLHKNKNGQIFSFLNIATHRFSYSQGQWKKSPHWHSVLVCGKNAELCEKYLEKGFPLAVEGVFDSTLCCETTILAEEVHFLGLQTLA